MKLTGLTWVSLWAALAAFVACSDARPVQHRQTPLEATTLLQETSRKSLRVVARAEQKESPEEVAALKQKVADLQADRKGLVLAVRRLMKANQTEAQKKMLNALRGSSMQAQAAEKKTEDVQAMYRAQIARVLKLQKETQEKLKQKVLELQKHDGDANKLEVTLRVQTALEMELKKNAADAAKQAGTTAKLQALVAKEESDLAAFRKRDEGVSSTRASLEAQVEQLRKQNTALQEEKKGLEATVEKLWNVNAPTGAKSMLKVLDEEEERLKVVDQTRQSEETQFAQEKSELSRKLNDAEHRYEVDEKFMKTLQGDNQWLRTSLQNQSSLEQRAKLADVLQEKNQELETELSKQKRNASYEFQVARVTQSGLQATLEKDETENQKLWKANQQLASESERRKTEFEKMKAIKDSDENIFAQQLTDLQKKVNDTEALVFRKDEEIKAASTRGMKFYVGKWEKAQAAIQSKIAAGLKNNKLLEAKAADLSHIVSKKDDEIAGLHKERADMENELKQEQSKLMYAVDKENAEMLHVDKLNAANAELGRALEKEKKLQPQVAKLQTREETLQALNLQFMNSEKREKEQLQKLNQTSQEAGQKVFQEESKLDFAVDQENTQMLAVKILQGENNKLKGALQNQTGMVAELRRLNAFEAAKGATIETLKAVLAKADANISLLMGQMASLKHTNELLQDQYIRERSKLGSIAEQDSTESLAFQVLQGDNQKLQEELKSATNDEAEMAQVAKTNQAKVEASDALEIDAGLMKKDSGQMKRDMAALRQKEAALQHKNDELQETIIVMTKKTQDEQAVRDFIKEPQHQEDVSQPDGLEKASLMLSKLELQMLSSTTTAAPDTSSLDGVEQIEKQMEMEGGDADADAREA